MDVCIQTASTALCNMLVNLPYWARETANVADTVYYLPNAYHYKTLVMMAFAITLPFTRDLFVVPCHCQKIPIWMVSVWEGQGVMRSLVGGLDQTVFIPGWPRNGFLRRPRSPAFHQHSIDIDHLPWRTAPLPIWMVSSLSGCGWVEYWWSWYFAVSRKVNEFVHLLLPPGSETILILGGWTFVKQSQRNQTPYQKRPYHY